MSRFVALALSSALIIPTPLAARDWADAGGWEVGEAGTDGCYMASEYEGEGDTLLIVNVHADGEAFISATNYGWSAKEKQGYDLTYALNGRVFRGGKSVGIVDGLRKGFGARMPGDFLNHFAAASSLHISTDDGVVIDQLNLEGSAAGLAQVRRCVAHVKAVAAAAAREKARFAHIPKDPFASIEGEPLPPKPPQPAASPAKGKANVRSLISADDYPAAALRNEEQGTVRYRLDIGSNGRVTGCTIMVSSGSSSLDATTCRILRSRARFTPAVDAAGNPTVDTVEDAYTWKLTSQ